ncbi:MAG: SGNH/GDSL hydrolase family protein [Candidatus Puniceispirillum sp.]|nr:SGNH/GDSL hydrolase family protein [Candidatus Puniceispirillum sp.]MBT6565536.1 SGNH/GDSL hydrolase family protein [Candidatus Puniceispirillum sp.]
MTRTLLCFGDSNTHGTPPMDSMSSQGRFEPDVRWPSVMRTQLAPGWTIIEEGHPGRTTVHDDPIGGIHKNGIRMLPALLETHRPLDVIVIMLGTNDLQHRFGVNATEIALAIGKIVEIIKASPSGIDQRAPDILLISPPPVIQAGCLADVFEGSIENANALSGTIANIARQHNVPYFDAGAHIAVSPIDGVHFDAESHITLGHAMAQAVRELFG